MHAPLVYRAFRRNAIIACCYELVRADPSAKQQATTSHSSEARRGFSSENSRDPALTSMLVLADVPKLFSSTTPPLAKTPSMTPAVARGVVNAATGRVSGSGSCARL